MSDTVLVEIENGVASVTLNRPDRMNSLTVEMMTTLRDRLAELSDDPEVRCVVLTGAGERAFSAGADLAPPGTGGNAASPGTRTLEASIDQLRRFQESSWLLHTMPKPTLAAINGAAVGLGFILPLYCDIRIASDKARFGTAFAQRGLIAEHGVSWMLPRLVGISNALDLLYSARLIDAGEALQMGLVSRVVPHDELMSTAREYAQHLASGVSPRSLRVIKKQVYEALFQTLGDAIETANDEMMASFQCEDFQEGVAHFLEKRPPVFSGK